MQYEGFSGNESGDDLLRVRKIGRMMTDTMMPVSAPISDEPSEIDTQRRPGYYLSPDDWPTDVPRDDLSIDEVYGVLDTFEDLYEAAMDGLSKVGEEETDSKG